MSVDRASQTAKAAPAAPERAPAPAPAPRAPAHDFAGSLGNQAMGGMAMGGPASVPVTPGFAGALGNQAMAQLARSRRPASGAAADGISRGDGRKPSDTTLALSEIRANALARSGTKYVSPDDLKNGMYKGQKAKDFPFKIGFDTTADGGSIDLTPSEEKNSKKGLRGSYPKKPLKFDKPLFSMPVFAGVMLALGVKFEAKIEGEITPKAGLKWTGDMDTKSTFELMGSGEGGIKLVAEGGIWAGVVGGVPGVASVMARITGGIALEGEGKIGMGPKGRITYDWQKEEWVDPTIGMQYNGELKASAKLQLKGSVDYELIFDSGTIYEWKIKEMPIAEAGAKLDVYCKHDGTVEDKSKVDPPKWGEVAETIKAVIKGEKPKAPPPPPPQSVDPAALMAEAYKNALPSDGGGGMTMASGATGVGTAPNSSEGGAPNQSVDPNAPNQSTMPPNQSVAPPAPPAASNAGAPNQSVDPNAGGPNQSTMPPNQSTMPGPEQVSNAPVGIYDEASGMCVMMDTDTKPIEPKPSF